MTYETAKKCFAMIAPSGIEAEESTIQQGIVLYCIKHPHPHTYFELQQNTTESRIVNRS